MDAWGEFGGQEDLLSEAGEEFLDTVGKETVEDRFGS